VRHADFSKLTGLEPIVSLSVVHWRMGADGWIFADGEGVIPDTVMVGTLVGIQEDAS
jgi:glutathionyl-hydroquinone reductase